MGSIALSMHGLRVVCRADAACMCHGGRQPLQTRAVQGEKGVLSVAERGQEYA